MRNAPKAGELAPATAEDYRRFLIAIAIGERLGLPYRDMPGKQVWKLTKGLIELRFLRGQRARITDGTEQALLTARALMTSAADIRIFENDLPVRFQHWLPAPALGAHKATFSSDTTVPSKESSLHAWASVGNGALMRAPIIGLFHCTADQEVRDSFVLASTRMSHSDPRTSFMAVGIADIVAHASQNRLTWDDASRLFRNAVSRLADLEDGAHVREFILLLKTLDKCHEEQAPLTKALNAIGCGKEIDSYVYRSALAAAYIATHSLGPQYAVERAILKGGDTASTAALTAAICAAAGQRSHIQMMSSKDWRYIAQLIDAHANGLWLRQGCFMSEPAKAQWYVKEIGGFILRTGHILRRMVTTRQGIS